MRENDPRKYLQLQVIHEKFIRGGPALYVMYVIKCSKNDATITCLSTKTSLATVSFGNMEEMMRGSFHAPCNEFTTFSSCSIYIMPVRRDGRSPNPSEKLKSRTMAEPESNSSAALPHSKGQIKTLTEQCRVTRQRQG